MTRTSTEILAEWQQCLEVIWRTPPNDEHFAAARRIDELVQPYQEAVERERVEAIANAESERVAKEAKAKEMQGKSGPDVTEVMLVARARIQTLTGIIGADAARQFCERAIVDRLADDAHGYLG